MALSPSELVPKNRSTPPTSSSELPEHEHKRPRLDTSPNDIPDIQRSAHLTMIESPSDIEAPTLTPHQHEPRHRTPSVGPSVTNKAASVASPTSKVTINTRLLSAQSANSEVVSESRKNDVEDSLPQDDVALTDAGDSHDAALPQSTETAVRSIQPKKLAAALVGHGDTPLTKSNNEMPGDATQPISVPSSPSDSVVIEIGDPEDIEEPYSTNWSSKVDPIWTSLPYLQGSSKSDLAEAMQYIRKVFDNGGETIFQQVLQKFAKWLHSIQPQLGSNGFDPTPMDSEVCSWVPLAISTLLRRRHAVPATVQATSLMRIFQTFAKMTMTLACFDVRRLMRVEDATTLAVAPWSLSLKYFDPLGPLLLQSNKNNIYSTLAQTHGIPERDFCSRLANSLFTEDAGRWFRVLLELLDHLDRSVPATSQRRHAIFPVAAAYRTSLNAISLWRVPIKDEQDNALHDITKAFVSKVDEVFQQAITKQHPWLTLENVGYCMEVVTGLASHAVDRFPEFVDPILSFALVRKQNLDPRELCDLSLIAHKLAMLKLLIQHGRMELRVWGTEVMSNDLVVVWQQQTQLPEDRARRKTEVVVEFLENNKMATYIFGVDSHPQIVQRSPNILGFLFISGSWKQSDSDVAWKALTESQDHRTVAAVAENLIQNVTQLSIEVMLDFFQRIQQLPFDRFDRRMLDLVMAMMRNMNQKLDHTRSRNYNVSLKVIEVWLHIVRSSHTRNRCASDLAMQVQSDLLTVVHDHLTSPAGYHIADVSEAEKSNLFQSLCEDMRNHNEYATGSLFCLTIFLESLDSFSVIRVVREYNIPQLLLEDMVHLTIHPGAADARSEKSCLMEFEVRLNTMRFLIDKCPSVFDENICAIFWKEILASKDQPTVRACAWNMLAQAYSKGHSANIVLGFTASHFMHDLSASMFDDAIFNFAKESVGFEIRQTVDPSSDRDNPLELPSMERVWRLMLEAPTGTVEELASDFIISIYLQHRAVTTKSLSAIETTHARLVDRCIQTVIKTAEQIRSHSPNTAGSVFDGSLDNINTQNEVRLHRSLVLLRKFLQGMKSSKHYRVSATASVGPTLRKFQARGEPLELHLQINHADFGNDKQSWKVGQENSGQELWHFLATLTGWSQFYIVNSGRKIHIEHDDETTLKDLKIMPGNLMLMKVADATQAGPGRGYRAPSPVDSKIMHHFEELYALLDSNERVAKAIFDFLTMFSSQESILSEIKSREVPVDTLLPVEKPFKLLYYATALRSCIEEESYSVEPNIQFLQYAVRTIISTLGRLKSQSTEPSLYIAILRGIMETLLLALRAKVPTTASMNYFDSAQAFVSRFLQTWTTFLDICPKPGDAFSQRALSRDFVDVMVESVLHDERLWQHFEQSEQFSVLFERAMLRERSQESRKSVLDIIARLAGVRLGKTSFKATDARTPRNRFPPTAIDSCLCHLWKLIAPLISTLGENSSNAHELLEAAYIVFETSSKKLDQDQLLQTYNDLKDLLLVQHDPPHGLYCVGEFIVSGIAKLIVRCISVLSSAGSTVPGKEDLIRCIFQQFLFPPLSDANNASVARQNRPLVEADARAVLYDVIVSFCQSTESLLLTATELSEAAIDQNAFSPTGPNERKALRSDQGYSGLRNLSNTCYLNSLLTQLFMNVKFRELIVGINIVDNKNQKLIAELANVFANMQSSCEKSIDPEEAVMSITQYTGEQIDVTVQMDVDEFFNLLFDRIESQIVDSSAREVFKAMYGGQLVQQIKSKDCEHVSERLEPFSAIQIEIKGKSCLEEGLAAYVEGEILQGENKYSCTSCGTHVDAVKRACIKELPDNLIFNLKRFDYDIMTGLRCKVNDEFSFPEEIDMMPYTIDALSEPERQLDSDIYELVGVIIHSGTAETGHYYSYIRERPSFRDAKESWIHFNDVDVTKFDLQQMREAAFGGVDAQFNALQRFYNGYMLFYQRRSSIKDYEHEYERFNPCHVTVDLPQYLDNCIAQENEICLRRYVTQDPAHAKFVREILERMRLQGDTCDGDHTLQDQILNITLEYARLVSSRWKEVPELEETHKVLVGYIKSCKICALHITEWFASDQNIMWTVLRAWYNRGRNFFASLLNVCFEVMFPLKHRDEELGPGAKQHFGAAVDKCLTQIKNHWNDIQTYNRGWEHFFYLLNSTAKSGDNQATALIENGVLERAAEIIWIHAPPYQKVPRIMRNRYNTYLAQREKNKTFIHATAVELFATLLPHVRLSNASMDNKTRMDISDHEQALLLNDEDSSTSFPWLRKLILGRTNPDAALLVVKGLCNYTDLLDKTGTTLIQGFKDNRYQIAAAFIRPCACFIEHCSDKQKLRPFLEQCLETIFYSNAGLAAEYLEFVLFVAKIEHLDCGLRSPYMIRQLLELIEMWAPPLLFAPNDIHRDVRGESLAYLNEILFTKVQHCIDQSQEVPPRYMSAIRGLAVGCIDYASKNFLAVQSANGRHLQRGSLSSQGQTQHVSQALRNCQQCLDENNAEDEQMVQDIQNALDEIYGLEQSAAEVHVEDLEWKAASSEQYSDIDSLEASP